MAAHRRRLRFHLHQAYHEIARLDEKLAQEEARAEREALQHSAALLALQRHEEAQEAYVRDIRPHLHSEGKEDADGGDDDDDTEDVPVCAVMTALLATQTRRFLPALYAVEFCLLGRAYAGHHRLLTETMGAGAGAARELACVLRHNLERQPVEVSALLLVALLLHRSAPPKGGRAPSVEKILPILRDALQQAAQQTASSAVARALLELAEVYAEETVSPQRRQALVVSLRATLGGWPPAYLTTMEAWLGVGAGETEGASEQVAAAAAVIVEGAAQHD